MSKHGPQQLSAMDAIFLTQEAAYMPMHIGLLMFYTPPNDWLTRSVGCDPRRRSR